MKTTMNIIIDKELKDAFSAFAKDIWTNPTNLANMLIKNAVNKRKVSFSNNIIEVEPDKWEIKIIEDYLKRKKEWKLESVSFTKDYFNNFK